MTNSVTVPEVDMRWWMAVTLGAVGCAAPEPQGNLGEQGRVSFDVVWDAEPLVAGPVVAEVTLTEAETGDPLEGATLTVEPWMPSMGHGSGEVVISEIGDGLYTAQWTWSMSGPWDVTFATSAPLEDTYAVSVDVE